MARPREKTSPVDAGRIAASRRGRRDPSAERAPRSAPADRGAKDRGAKDRGAKDRGGGKKAKTSGRGKKGAASSPLQKALKLVMLVLLMAALGFGTVLILDVGMTLVGGLKLGSLTFSELVDKVSDRVFDHDVPEAKKKPVAPVPKPRGQAQVRSSSGASVEATPTARAPLEAPSPDAYAKDAVVRPDPEVKAARERLDQLLKGL